MKISNLTQPFIFIQHPKIVCLIFLKIMRTVKNIILQAGNWKLLKVDPNIVLFLIVIAFVALLLATENIVKYTLLPQ